MTLAVLLYVIFHAEDPLRANFFVGATLAVAVGFCASMPSRAATVGLWTFDTIGDTTDVAAGEVLYDTSGNNLHFVRGVNAGNVLISTDVPSVAAAGSYSLFVNAGGRGLDTPSTDLLSIGKTGQLTIEFWYKPLIADTVRFIFSQTTGVAAPAKNGYSLAQTVPVSSASGLDFVTTNDNSTLIRWRDGDKFITNQNGAGSGQGWMHLALTIDSATGEYKLYRDGLLDLTNNRTGFTPYASVEAVLRLGASSANGNTGTFMIDDLRISDVVLPSGSGTGMNELAWNASLANIQAPPPRPANFGKQWVRNHDFTISAWAYTDYPNLYTDAHFNAALTNGYQAANNGGVMPMYLGVLTELNDQTRTLIHIALNSGVKAFLLRDELPFDEIAGFREVADYIRSIDSEALIIAGLSGSNHPYGNNVMTNAKPDAVIHGYYPFHGPTGADDDWYWGGLTDVAYVRHTALLYDVPYFAYVQSFEDLLDRPNHNPLEQRRRLPNESELRAELFSKLSAGIQGFAYFKFQKGINEDMAIVDPFGVTSSLYEPAKKANAEVLNLGQSLRFLTSTDWRFKSGGVAATPQMMTAWNAGAGNGLIVDITIHGTPQDRRDALVGYFTDDDGGEYFMFVNTFHGDNLDALDATVDFTLLFDSSIDTIWRLNRLTGAVEQIDLVGNSLSLTLPGGTGDLFKFYDGNFAGVVIPEPGTLVLFLATTLACLRPRRGDAPRS